MNAEMFIKRIKEIHPEFKFRWREPLSSSFLSGSVVIYTKVYCQELSMSIRLSDLVMSDGYINMIVHEFKVQEERLNAQTKK